MTRIREITTIRTCTMARNTRAQSALSANNHPFRSWSSEGEVCSRVHHDGESCKPDPFCGESNIHAPTTKHTHFYHTHTFRPPIPVAVSEHSATSEGPSFLSRVRWALWVALWVALEVGAVMSILILGTTVGISQSLPLTQTRDLY